MLFYHFLWTFVGGPLLAGCRIYKSPRLMERLACRLPRVSIKPNCIWVHALSVGEVISAIPLVRRLSGEYPDKDLVFSATTVQGLDLARKELDGMARAILAMPLDFWWATVRMIRYLKPRVFLLIETDLWPGLLSLLRAKGVESLLINGRISEGTFKTYKRAPFLARRLFRDLGFCLMQTEQDRERLLHIGVPAQKVVAVGNIKFDRTWAPMETQEKAYWINLFGLSQHTIVWVAGSTHGEESEQILDVFFNLQEGYPNLVLILAPRKIEESRRLFDLVRARGRSCVLRSQANGDVHRPDVIILDSVGELGRIYGIGHISFVGGSLIPFGGHNLLEPASFGVPVLFGPHTENFAWMAQGLVESGGGVRIRNYKDLFEAIDKLLGDSNTRVEMGKAAQRFVMNNQGALDRVMGYIESCLHPRGDTA